MRTFFFSDSISENSLISTVFDDDYDVILIGPNHHPFPQKGSCHSVGAGFVLSGSPWHQC